MASKPIAGRFTDETTARGDAIWSYGSDVRLSRWAMSSPAGSATRATGPETPLGLTGTSGDDTLDPGRGREPVSGGAGFDTLKLDWSDVTGYGIDVPSLSGTLTDGYAGTFRSYYDYPDRYRVDFDGIERFDLSLTQAADYVITGDAGDIVKGNGGDDTLSTGGGADQIDGGIGTDHWIADKSLNPTGTANTQNFVIDLTQTGTQATYFTTGSVAGIERLTLTTGAGNDTITTLSTFLNDTLTTGAGNDTVTIASGRDTVAMGTQGSAGDTLVIDWSAITGYGFDVATLTLDADGYYGTLRSYYDYSDRNRVDFSGVEHFRVSLSQAADTFLTGNGNDTVYGNAGNDYIASGKGADVIDGGTGNDRWLADKSDVAKLRIDLNAASSTFKVGTLTGSVAGIEALGRDTADDGYFRSGTGADTITTFRGFFSDFIDTGDGDDTVSIYAGKDTIAMGAGTDTLVIDWSDLSVDAGYGYDSPTLGGDATAGYNGVLRAYYDYSDRNNVSFSGVEKFVIRFGGGSDAARTGDYDDTVSGGAGNDFFATGKGADSVDGGVNADGTQGIDRWSGDKSAATTAMVINLATASSYTVGGVTATVQNIEALGESNSDGARFSTGSGNDVVTTTALFLNDYLETNGGDDTVKVYGGKDVVLMGAGNDTLVVDYSGTTDYEYLSFNFAVSASGGYSGILRAYYDYSDRNNVTFDGVEHFQIKTGSQNDSVVTGAGNDIVSTGAGDDAINTGTGVDIVDGGDGVDSWTADQSAVTSAIVIDLTKTGLQGVFAGRSVSNVEALSLTTGSGADQIATGYAFLTDNIVTGAGNDQVLIAGGKDTVDLGTGVDLLAIDWSATTAGINYSSLDGTLAGGYSGLLQTYYNYSGEQRLAFAGVENFAVLLGSGDDTITTGDGNDAVSGGAGNDTIRTGRGVDRVDGGAGVDFWQADQSAVTAAVDLDLNRTVTQASFAGRTVAGMEILNLATGSGNDTIVTLGAFYNDVIATNGGDDKVTVAGGKDSVSMGAGTDTLIVDWSTMTAGIAYSGLSGTFADSYSGLLQTYYNYSDENRVEFSGVEHFRVTLGSGNDTLNTGDGNDILSTGAGDDTISSGTGVDIVDGGDGSDYLTADQSAVTVGIDFDLARTGVQASFAGRSISGIEGINFISGSGDDNIRTLGTFTSDYVTTGAGSDRVFVAGGKDSVSLGTGDDLLEIDWRTMTAGITYSGISGTLANGYSGLLQTYYNYSTENRVEFTGVERFRVLLGSGNDTLNTGDGDDYLDGGAGIDTMTGGGGNDVYVVDDAGDVVNEAAGGGTDEIRTTLATYSLAGLANVENLTGIAAAGVAQTLTGNAANNVIDGGVGADTMTGGLGDDTYYVDDAGDVVVENAGEGDDLVVTTLKKYVLAAEVERLTGTLATGQTLTGNALANTIIGADGNDKIDGGRGNDTMQGGKGDDTYYVDRAGDKVIEKAGEGRDTVVTSLAAYALGNNLEDLVGTRAAGATLTGNALANSITGAAGADTIDGGLGADTMTGGQGDDTYVVDDAGDLVVELAGEGVDTVRTALSYTLSANVERLVLLGAAMVTGTGNALANTLIANDAGDTLNGLAGADTLIGGAGGDTLDGGTGADAMTGGAGNDTYYVDDAGDTVTELAGEGDDHVITTLGAYTLGSNIERLTGASATGQVLTGNGSDNTITAGDGDDTLNGGAGADLMVGGRGNDIYYVDQAGDVVVEQADAGFDTIVTSLATYSLVGLDNVEILTGTNAAGQTLTGNATVNIITGAAGNDLIDGGAGGDVLEGGLGDDIYIVDDVSDAVIERFGEGNDTVRTTLATYTLDANVENLTFTGLAAATGTGNALANRIIGSVGADKLYGLGGDDVLDGGAGADRLYGGSGDDTYVVDDARDKVFEATGDGYDTVLSSVSLTLAGNVEALVLTGTAAVGRGNGLDNAITGNDAANTLSGGGGNDLLIGGGGNDRLDGGAGVDMMTGGTGDDTYYVDNSGDQVVEAAGDGVDRVIVIARIDYTLPDNVENLTVMFGFSGTGNALANEIVSGAGNNTLSGMGGDDILRGGEGKDTLDGGTGNDLLLGEAGRDILTGGQGADTFAFREGDTGNTAATADVIMDFSRAEGDIIQVKPIDANVLVDGNQAFTFIGDAAFTGAAGQLRYENIGTSYTMIYADTNGDAVADYAIRVQGEQHFIATDFNL